MSDKRKRRCLLHELHNCVILPKHPNLSTSHPPFYLLPYLPIFFTVSFSSYRLPWASSPSINSLTMSLRPVHSAAARKETRGANASSLSFSVLSGGVTSTPLKPDLPRPFASAAAAPSKTGFSFARMHGFAKQYGSLEIPVMFFFSSSGEYRRMHSQY